MLLPRSDGKKLKGLGLTRRFMPLMIPRRNDAVVYYEQKVNVKKLDQFLVDFRKKHGYRLTMLHCVLYALAKRIKDRPYMNRFIKGPYAYQRKGIWMSFAAKRAYSDEAAMRVVKKEIDPNKTLLQVAQELDGGIDEARNAKSTTTDTELSFFFKLPTFVFMLILKLQAFLDYFGLMPSFMIKSDPMYSSVFVAHLGSVGLDAAYHHLFEYGTVPIFLVIGKSKDEVVARDGKIVIERLATFRYSYDERIADGFYTSSTLALLQDMLENPEEHLV